MAKYICPQCSKAFIYCKGCALTPDIYKEKGFCSKECYNTSKTEIPKKTKSKPSKKELVVVEPIELVVEPKEEVSIIDENKEDTFIEVELFEDKIDGIHE